MEQVIGVSNFMGKQGGVTMKSNTEPGNAGYPSYKYIREKPFSLGCL